MFIKPKAGCTVRDPTTMEKLPEEGREVPRMSFWIRALARGDVVEAAEKEPPSEFGANGANAG